MKNKTARNKKMGLRVKTFRHRLPNEFGIKLVMFPSAEKFTMVNAEMTDGTTRDLWISDERQGYFKQVFVPWDFEDPAVV